MSLKLRLIGMNFLQFYVWGAWLITIGRYWFENKGWPGTSFGAMFSTMGIASLFMPALMGIVADRWVNAERLYGILHILGAICLFALPNASSPQSMFWVMLAAMVCYMPTISLAITVAYNALKRVNLDVVREFPPIRVWGTVGFIAAMWCTSLFGFEKTAMQFYVAGIAAIGLGLYAFTLPPCPPKLERSITGTWVDALGFNAFRLFRNPQMAVFFLFAMLLGAALQLTNAYGGTFLGEFETNPQYRDTLAVKFPAMIMSISQISETLFILAIPFFLRHWGIKRVMTISMIAWCLRFGLFAFGNPGDGLWMIILSCIVYGMAFDFFNISGSLFVEQQSDPRIRASAQGLFMLMTNGIGAVFGSLIAGYVIDTWYTESDGVKDWHGIWMAFAAYSLAMAVAFVFLFRYKHSPAPPEQALKGHTPSDVNAP